jgi:hypothetical protein
MTTVLHRKSHCIGALRGSRVIRFPPSGAIYDGFPNLGFRYSMNTRHLIRLINCLSHSRDGTALFP